MSSVGAIEPQFYAELLERLGPRRASRAAQAARPRRLAGAAGALRRGCSARKTRDEWCALLEGTDACFAPVLALGEAPQHPHNVARGTFVELDGVVQPAPAPRFSRTRPRLPARPPAPGEHTREVLSEWGFSDDDELSRLLSAGAVRDGARAAAASA